VTLGRQTDVNSFGTWSNLLLLTENRIIKCFDFIYFLIIYLFNVNKNPNLIVFFRFINARRRIVQPMIDQSNRAGKSPVVTIFKSRRCKSSSSQSPDLSPGKIKIFRWKQSCKTLKHWAEVLEKGHHESTVIKTLAAILCLVQLYTCF